MKKLFPIISLILGLILFIAVMAWVGVGDIFKVFLRINPFYLLIYFLVSISIFFGYVLRWWIIIRVSTRKGVHIGRLFFYKTAGYAISYLTPFAKLGGEPVQTYFLSKEKIDMAHAASTVVIDKMLELTANVIFSLIGLIILALSFTLPKGSMTAIIWGLAFFVALIAIFYYRMLLGLGFFSSIIDFFRLTRFKAIRANRWKIRDGEKRITDFYRSHKAAFISCSIISFALWVLSFLEFKLLMWVFDYEFSLAVLFFVVVFMGIATLFPFPAALGSQEAGQVTLFKIIGAEGNVGIGISLITRVRDILWTIVGLVFMYYKGVKRHFVSLLKKRKDRIDFKF